MATKKLLSRHRVGACALAAGELLQPYALSLIESTLVQGITEGTVADLPPRPLAHALVAVAEEAAMYIASAEDRETARGEMRLVIERLLAALTVA